MVVCVLHRYRAVQYLEEGVVISARISSQVRLELCSYGGLELLHRITLCVNYKYVVRHDP